MTDEELVLYFNEHRLAKLESYLLKNGSSVEHELQNLLDRFYEQTVPEHERMEVEAQIELEREREAAEREASRRFAVVHFHEGDDDFFFTSELRNSFYSIANLYRSTLKDEVGKYTLDSIAQSNFSGCQAINNMTFSVLCSAMPNDPRITALVEFDFDHNTVSVCESSDNAWWTYSLPRTTTNSSAFSPQPETPPRQECWSKWFQAAIILRSCATLLKDLCAARNTQTSW